MLTTIRSAPSGPRFKVLTATSGQIVQRTRAESHVTDGFARVSEGDIWYEVKATLNSLSEPTLRPQLTNIQPGNAVEVELNLPIRTASDQEAKCADCELQISTDGGETWSAVWEGCFNVESKGAAFVRLRSSPVVVDSPSVIARAMVNNGTGVPSEEANAYFDIKTYDSGDPEPANSPLTLELFEVVP